MVKPTAVFDLPSGIKVARAADEKNDFWKSRLHFTEQLPTFFFTWKGN